MRNPLAGAVPVLVDDFAQQLLHAVLLRAGLRSQYIQAWMLHGSGHAVLHAAPL